MVFDAILIVYSCFFPTFQRDERVLVVWSDNIDNIIPQCNYFEEHLVKLVFTQRQSLVGMTPGQSIAASPALTSTVTSVANSSSDVQLDEKLQEQDTEKGPARAPDPRAKPISGGSLWGWRIGSRAKQAPSPRDLEKAGAGANARPTRYFGPVYGGLGLALSTCAISLHVQRFCDADKSYTVFIGSGVSMLLQEFRLTQDFTRFALLATVPLLFCVSLVSPYHTSVT